MRYKLSKFKTLLSLEACTFHIKKKKFYYFQKFGNGFVRFRLVLHRSMFLLLYKKLIYAISLNSINTSFLLGYLKWLSYLLKGYRRWYKTKFQLYGLGNRLLGGKGRRLRITLGYSHRLFIKLTDGSKLKKIKKRKKRQRNLFAFRCSNWYIFNNTIFILRKLKFPDAYNANGVRFLNERVRLKPRKKWGVI